MKPTDKNLELLKQLEKADVEVQAGKPGHGASRVVLIDGEGEKPTRDGAFIGKNDHMAGIDAMVMEFINAGDPIKIFSPGDEPIDGSSTVVFTDGELIYTIEGEVVRKNQPNTDAEKAAFNKELDDAMNEWIKSPNDPAALEKVRNLTNMLPGAINDPNQTKPFAMVERLKEMMSKYPEFAPAELDLGLPANGAFRSVNFAAGTLAVDGISGLDDKLTNVLSAPPTSKKAFDAVGRLFGAGSVDSQKSGITFIDDVNTGEATFPGISDFVKSYNPKFSLEEWIDIKEKSPLGLDPILGDFMKANPSYFDPDSVEGDGVTLRLVGHASDMLRGFNQTNIFAKESVWVAPKALLSACLPPGLANELIQFAKDKGIQVSTMEGKANPSVEIDDDALEP